LLRPWKAALRDMWYRGWGRSLSRKTSDHWMLLARSFHEKRFARYCGYPREMSSVYDWDSTHIPKGPFTRQYGVRRYCRKGLAQWGREKGFCLRKHGALYLVLSFLSSVTLTSSLFSLVTSLDVRLQVSLGEITTAASRDSITTSSN